MHCSPNNFDMLYGTCGFSGVDDVTFHFFFLYHSIVFLMPSSKPTFGLKFRILSAFFMLGTLISTSGYFISLNSIFDFEFASLMTVCAVCSVVDVACGVPMLKTSPSDAFVVKVASIASTMSVIYHHYLTCDPGSCTVKGSFLTAFAMKLWIAPSPTCLGP